MVYPSRRSAGGLGIRRTTPEVPGFEDFGGMWECPTIERIPAEGTS